MCYESILTHPMRGISYCGCGFRQFLSAEEEVELLEGYRNQLQKEMAGVEERIKELKRKG